MFSHQPEREGVLTTPHLVPSAAGISRSPLYPKFDWPSITHQRVSSSCGAVWPSVVTSPEGSTVVACVFKNEFFVQTLNNPLWATLDVHIPLTYIPSSTRGPLFKCLRVMASVPSLASIPGRIMALSASYCCCADTLSSQTLSLLLPFSRRRPSGDRAGLALGVLSLMWVRIRCQTPEIF